MTKKLVFFLLYLLSILPLAEAQKGVKIMVKLQGYGYDTLWFGHTFGKRAVPDFYGVKNAEGWFVLQTEKPVEPGMAAIIHKRSPNANYQYFQCWLPDDEREFSIETHITDPYARPSVKGSKENETFFRYLRVSAQLDDHLDSLLDDFRYRQDEISFNRRVNAEKDFRSFQDDFIAQYPGTLTAKLVQQTLYQLPPDNKTKTVDFRQDALDRWHWQRQHYFDNMDISTSDFMRYPQWLERTDFYLFHLPPADPDSTKSVLDEVFQRLSANPEALEYYQKYLTNSLGRMSQFRLDEVFVYVVRKYVQGGKAPWTDADTEQKLIADADRMEPLFVGKKAPNITLYDKNEQPVELYGIKAKATMLVFWMPDCSHCKKEMPILKKIYERYKAKGLEVMSVCGKFQAETPLCWEFVDTQQLPAEWHLVSDPHRRSGMANLFNLRSFPRIFVLDENKNILFKRAGEASEIELEKALDQLK